MVKDKQEEVTFGGFTPEECLEIIDKIKFAKNNLMFIAGTMFVLSSSYDESNEELNFNCTGEELLESIILTSRICGEDDKFLAGFIKEVSSGLNKLDAAIRHDLQIGKTDDK